MIRYTLFIFLCFFISAQSIAQDFNGVDIIIKSYPKSFDKVEVLAERIANDFENDYERVRAVYVWLSLNVQYNYFKDNFDLSKKLIVSSSTYEKEYLLKRRRLHKINKLLKTRKGVCLDYSYTLKELCDRLNITSTIITGYSKTSLDDIGNIKGYKDHAWNAVRIDGKWNLLDVTWGAFYSNQKKIDDYYFFTAPDEFIKSHLPIERKWQLIDRLVTKKDFFNSPLFYHYYFVDGVKISNSSTIKKENKRVNILFDSIPKGKSLFYGHKGSAYVKPIKLNKRQNGDYVATIKIKEDDISKITIYADQKPVIGLKIK